MGGHHGGIALFEATSAQKIDFGRSKVDFELPGGILYPCLLYVVASRFPPHFYTPKFAKKRWFSEGADMAKM